MQIRDGQRLIERLAAEGIAVTAAGWVQESDGSLWYLYLVTPLVNKKEDTLPAYRRIGPIIVEMQKEGSWIEPSDVKAIGPHDPIARDMVAHWGRRRARTPMRFQAWRLGELAVEDACIYPPTADPKEAGVSEE